MNPRVYVGTYHKYNCGSIAGGWISLKKCKDYADFVHKCKKLHSDEADPELMIQDTDDMPDGLSCGESMPSEMEFNDIIAACKEEEKESKKKSNDKELIGEYMFECVKVWGNDKEMLDYCYKKFSYAIRLQNGGILPFEKPRIENRFCWADEGVSLENYNYVTSNEERLKQYFLQENLAGFDEEIKQLSKSDDVLGTLYIERLGGEDSTQNLWRWCLWNDYDVKVNPWKYKGDHEKMSDADRKTILAAVQHERDKFEKRLNTYLKRYGTSKIRTWTYWADA